MKGRILGYRGGKRTQFKRQMIVELKIGDKETQEFLGKEVVWKNPKGKEIRGEVTKEHGNKRKVIVNFEKGLPGQAINDEVQVE